MSDFKAKMHQIDCRLGLCPDPAGRDYSAPPNLPSWILRAYFEGRGEGIREEGTGREGRVEKGSKEKRGGRDGEGRDGEWRGQGRPQS